MEDIVKDREKQLEDPDYSEVQRLYLNFIEYLQLRLEYYQLVGADKIGGGISSVILYAIIAVLGVNFWLFFNIFMGILLTDYTNSAIIGFGIVAAYNLFFILFFLIFKRWLIQEPITKAILNNALKNVRSDG